MLEISKTINGYFLIKLNGKILKPKKILNDKLKIFQMFYYELGYNSEIIPQLKSKINYKYIKKNATTKK